MTLRGWYETMPWHENDDGHLLHGTDRRDYVERVNSTHSELTLIGSGLPVSGSGIIPRNCDDMQFNYRYRTRRSTP